MNKTTVFALIAALLAVWFVIRRKEHFTTEFVDQSPARKTDLTRKSSYAQETNHFKPIPFPEEPLAGVETPFRVNMFNSYME